MNNLVNSNPQQLGPAMDPAFTQALLQALTQNKQLDTLKFLQQSGLTRNIQSSPRNVGGAENPSLQQLRGESGPFFRSEADRQARIASSPASQAPSLQFSSSPTFNSRFGGPGIRPTPAPALGSPENPFQGPNDSRFVALPNGSLGAGGLPNMPGPNMQGNEDLAPFMEHARGIFADPRSYSSGSAQAAAMDAQDLRQGHIQNSLRGMVANTPQNPVRQSVTSTVSTTPAGYSLDELANGSQSGGTIAPKPQTTPLNASPAASPQPAVSAGGRPHGPQSRNAGLFPNVVGPEVAPNYDTSPIMGDLKDLMSYFALGTAGAANTVNDYVVDPIAGYFGGSTKPAQPLQQSLWQNILGWLQEQGQTQPR